MRKKSTKHEGEKEESRKHIMTKNIFINIDTVSLTNN